MQVREFGPGGEALREQPGRHGGGNPAAARPLENAHSCEVQRRTGPAVRSQRVCRADRFTLEQRQRDRHRVRVEVWLQPGPIHRALTPERRAVNAHDGLHVGRRCGADREPGQRRRRREPVRRQAHESFAEQMPTV
jgi:hypothetical protein